MAAYVRARVFNPLGYALGEIEIAPRYSWVLNGIGRMDADYPIFNSTGAGYNPKLTPALFNYGNFILLEHSPSKNNDGTTNGKLPDWIGMVYTPQIWDEKVTITAYSAEALLKYRALPVGTSILGNPGSMFNQILNFANQSGGIRIAPGIIDMTGPYNRNALAATAYDHVSQLQKQANHDFEITGLVDANNNLKLFGNWYSRKGVKTNQVLSNSSLQKSPQMYTEQGEFWNVVIVYTDDKTLGTRALATATDYQSIDKHGVLQTTVKYPGSAGDASDVVQAYANAYLAQYSQPTKTFAPTVVDFGQIFSFLATGNVLNVQNDTVGFYAGGIGFNGTVRILVAEMDTLTNVVKLTVQVLS